MTYYTGSVAAVPTANKQKYIEHLSVAWPLMQKYGATRMVETWGDNVPSGKVTDFQGAVNAKDDETVVFSWIEWPDRATADAAWPQMETDPEMKAIPEMPFDGQRMIFGGFEELITEGVDKGGYYQGFLTPIPEANKAAFEKLAHEAWDEHFKPKGCLGSYESWGVDLPRGKQTDFYRATKAEDGETVVFSFTAWPDRATCDKAEQDMSASMEGQEMPEMPFDGKRMIWGGFQPIFDSEKS